MGGWVNLSHLVISLCQDGSNRPERAMSIVLREKGYGGWGKEGKHYPNLCLFSLDSIWDFSLIALLIVLNYLLFNVLPLAERAEVVWSGLLYFREP